MTSFISLYLYIALIWFIQEIIDKTSLPKAFIISLFWGAQVLDELRLGIVKYWKRKFLNHK